MSRKCKPCFIIMLVLMFCFDLAESQAPFSRGVNLTGWFQSGSPGQIQFTKFTREDIQNIKSLGCDVIRLPVNMHGMTIGSPSYTLDPMYVSFLDSVVTWCEDLKVYLIIDNHSFDPNVNTSPDIGTILTAVWSQTAAHYKDRSDYILYEILNEPHGISTATWGSIQGNVINAIRAYDTRHTIVVGGSGFNTYTELKNLPVYADANLLYTFHFYDPFMFTHQGASWTSPSMEPLSGVPFPYDVAGMPLCPESLKGTWIESSLNNYQNEGTVNYVKQLIDNAISFKSSRLVNIFCGEFGVYIPNSDPSYRAYWYDIVRQYLEENNIPWTTWDYQGGFGLFNKGSGEMFEHDLNVPLLQSLNLNVPPQTPYSVKPDSTAITIYNDYIAHNINDISYSSGPIDFYSTDLPDNGKYCLSWNSFKQYNAIGFDFSPDRDLSRLVSQGYAIDLMVRGNQPGIKFDIRFIDSKSDISSDHPWRMGITIDESVATWDKRWHHLYIPLASFTEKGSWDNNTWYNPEGKFDWSATDRLEISTEYPVTTSQKLWFDNIYISNQDTAIVRESGKVGIEKIIHAPDLHFSVSPNPMKNSAKISFTLEEPVHITISIFSSAGIKIRTLANSIPVSGDQSFVWDGSNDSGYQVPRGFYICQLSTSQFFYSGKIIKN